MANDQKETDVILFDEELYFPELYAFENTMSLSKLTLDPSKLPRFARIQTTLREPNGPHHFLTEISLDKVHTDSDETLIVFLEQLSDTLAAMVQAGTAEIKIISLDGLLFTKQSFAVLVDRFFRRFNDSLVSLTLANLFNRRYEECRESFPLLGCFLSQSNLSNLAMCDFPSLDNHDPLSGTLFPILAPSLSQIKSLKSLKIGSWGIGAEGAASICQVIHKCPLLHTLYLISTHIGNVGAKSITEALRDVALTGRGLSLRRLDLERNRISSIEPFITLIQTRGVEIVKLWLSQNCLDQQSIAKSFGEALFQSNLFLKFVKLRGVNTKYIHRNIDLLHFVTREAIRLLVAARVLRRLSVLTNPPTSRSTTQDDDQKGSAPVKQQNTYWLPLELVKRVLHFLPERDILSLTQINNVFSFACHGWPLSEDTKQAYDHIIGNNRDIKDFYHRGVGTQPYFLVGTGCLSLTGPQWFRPDIIDWAIERFASADDLSNFCTRTY